MARIAAIDLFGGAGGLSLGATQAGVSVRALVDFDAHACATIRANASHLDTAVVEQDVTTVSGKDLREEALLARDDPLMIVGGAPCQPFSKAAYWLDPGRELAYRRDRAAGRHRTRPAPPAVRPDERRSLVDEYYRLVRETRADAFVFENVPSLLHPRNRPVLDRLLAHAMRDGFETTVVEANAADFGVPQRRQRVFVLASKAGRPNPPVSSHSVRTGRFKASGPAITPFKADKYYEPEEEVKGRWAKHLEEIPPGMNYKHHTSWAGHRKPTFVAETRFWNFLLKLDPAQTSWTLPASPGPWVGPFHWDSRRLRTPEMAALQGFPKGYAFSGPRRERVRQIGNAVPPPLGKAMVASVLATLEERPMIEVAV